MRRLPSLLLSCVASLGCLVLAACHGPREHSDFEAEGAGPRPIAMRGDNTFFAGKLRVEATVSRGRAVPFSDKADRKGGGGGGGGRHGEGRGGYGGGPGEAGRDDGDTSSHYISRGLAPAVTLRLKLENLTKENLSIQIRDVNSDLGDFAVRPDKVILAPDQSVELDPMVSELGVTSDEIPVTVLLASGKTVEKKDVLLKNLFTPVAADPAKK